MLPPSVSNSDSLTRHTHIVHLVNKVILIKNKTQTSVPLTTCELTEHRGRAASCCRFSSLCSEQQPFSSPLPLISRISGMERMELVYVDVFALIPSRDNQNKSWPGAGQNKAPVSKPLSSLLSPSLFIVLKQSNSLCSS